MLQLESTLQDASKDDMDTPGDENCESSRDGEGQQECLEETHINPSTETSPTKLVDDSSALPVNDEDAWGSVFKPSKKKENKS